jgi:hypothetical protein
VVTMLGDAQLLGETFRRTVGTPRTFSGRQVIPESNSGGDRSGGDSLPDLGKMQTMAPIGGFSSRFRQEGGRGSRARPDARFRRVEAAATSLAVGREGGRR